MTVLEQSQPPELAVADKKALSMSVLSSLVATSLTWQPTPVFLPGKSQGRQSLVGCRLWGCTESDTTEAT